MANVFARVQMTVEIAVQDNWSLETTAAQIQRQAIASAEEALRRGLIINGLKIVGSSHPVAASIVGAPIVTMVLARTSPSESDGGPT